MREKLMNYFKRKLGGEDEEDIISAAQGGMITDLTQDPEYRGWKKCTKRIQR